MKKCGIMCSRGLGPQNCQCWGPVITAIIFETATQEYVKTFKKPFSTICPTKITYQNLLHPKTTNTPTSTSLPNCQPNTQLAENPQSLATTFVIRSKTQGKSLATSHLRHRHGYLQRRTGRELHLPTYLLMAEGRVPNTERNRCLNWTRGEMG